MLCVVMIFTSIPAISFAADETGRSVNQELDADSMGILCEEESLSDTLVFEETVSKENAILDESTETTTIFDLGDGKKVAIFPGSQRLCMHMEARSCLKNSPHSRNIWFDSCNSKYHKKMKKLSKEFASGTTYQNKWGNIYVHDSSTWKEKTFTWKFKN